MNSSITVGLAQISPVWLNKAATIKKMLDYIVTAAAQQCQLIAFGEALLPGYPFWVELTNGAAFNSSLQKEMYAHYAYQSISIANGDLTPFCEIAKEKKINIVLGFMERADDRGGHSLYCSLTNINTDGKIEYVHRKLMPTYEERLVWAIGDGNGLQVRKLNDFTVGVLNCWENWMPLVRSTLYAQGEDLHIALWPGSVRNTSEITRFIAKESRSYVLSVSSLLHKKDISPSLPVATEMLAKSDEWLADGGSCIAKPNGEWLLAPVQYEEGLFVQTLQHQAILEERQNFDPSGHYARPDVLQLTVNRERQKLVHFKDEI
ncbi:carbon-nitrogen hydrolase family protein [Pedobacter sp. Hv1]|uniref:carbon-nitrogen hydrolase family protein n=1 Tax=Pedobacter sp. Hv1 TaxID=1740090 RepID=UPI0006D8B9E1|nr:carbon-nitrogen hydrolase family protein [Pedobacter sp. Hv1]KQC00744.1 carbon-nitrogen hydrolase [Pedobacter sp. Hv1]